ncbi:hypothetical protein AA313_de0209747 [Arthrobotrys entomopaga]|nr:hypothetical protein AA313_de0209747 [Arthrobotrys entomopaga]
MNLAISWESQGGNTLLCNNPSQWCLTVADFRNWRVVEQDDVQPLLDIIASIPGHLNMKKIKELKEVSTKKNENEGAKIAAKAIFKLESTKDSGYLTMHKVTASQKDFKRMVNKVISNQKGKGFNPCQHLQHDARIYDTSGSRVEITSSSENLSTFTARYSQGTPVDELEHEVRYQLLDSQETQTFHGFQIPPVSLEASKTYLKSCLVEKFESQTDIMFRTPGEYKKTGKIESDDIVEMAGYKEDYLGLLTKVAGDDNLGYQFLPWTAGNHVLNFKIVYSK